MAARRTLSPSGPFGMSENRCGSGSRFFPRFSEISNLSSSRWTISPAGASVSAINTSPPSLILKSWAGKRKRKADRPLGRELGAVGVRLQPADTLGVVDQFFLGHVLSIEHGPPF